MYLNIQPTEVSENMSKIPGICIFNLLYLVIQQLDSRVFIKITTTTQPQFLHKNRRNMRRSWRFKPLVVVRHGSTPPKIVPFSLTLWFV